MLNFFKTLYRKVWGRPTLADLLSRLSQTENDLIKLETDCRNKADAYSKQMEDLRKKREVITVEADYVASVIEGIRNIYL